MIGKKVQVYFNITKKVFSVKDKKTGLVIAHVNHIYLEDVIFKVSEKGRQRVLDKKVKNVHAYVEGTVYLQNLNTLEYKETITYNPYKYDSFIYVGTEKKIEKCKNVAMYINNKIPMTYKIKA